MRTPLILLLCSPGLALAQASTAAAAAAPPSLGGSAFQMLLSLAGVLCILFGGLWLLKRLTGRQGSNANLVRVISGTSLGTRERVVVVEVGQTWLVLGVTPTQINTLAEMPRQAVPAQDRQATDVPKWLKKMLDKRNARQAP